MTQVWYTGAGARYHRTRECQGLADGQAKAVSDGYALRTPTMRSLRELDSTVAPCLVCWRSELATDAWLRPLLATEATGDSPYEVDFMTNVLRRLSTLDPDFLMVQHPAKGESGKDYRIDFAILRPGLPKIAIEIDGFQKDKDLNESHPARQASSHARQNDLINADWKVLRFTNRQANFDPGECRRAIEAALTRPSTGMVARPPEYRSPSEHGFRAAHPNGPPLYITPGRNTAPTSSGQSASEQIRGDDLGDKTRPLLIRGLVLLALVSASLIVWAVVSSSQTPNEGNQVSPVGFDCPDGHPVKGNVTEAEERIYHLPGWTYYERTRPESCFADAQAASDAGFRASEVQ